MGVFVSIDQVSASEMNEPLIISNYANIFDMDIVQEQAVMIQQKITMATFYGGVTGVPGFGTVWGEFTPSSRRVTVQAKGTKTVNVTGGPRVEVRAEAPRAFTGNTSGWWWA
ncbi:hypothetical protein CYK55_00925 [Enterococcus mundtii]|nr:hypothetical protein CYK55_00925 [Enterococcus mundtii]